MMDGQSQNTNEVTDSGRMKDSLRRLEQSKNRPMTARLKEVVPNVESALAAGVRLRDIHKVLVAEGLDGLSFPVFKSLLHQIRKGSKMNKYQKQRNEPFMLSVPAKANPAGKNPLSVLSGKPKPNEFSPIPTKIEIE